MPGRGSSPLVGRLPWFSPAPRNRPAARRKAGVLWPVIKALLIRESSYARKKEDQAIDFQKEVFQQSGRLPTFRQLADLVGRNPATIQEWPRLMEARRKAKAKGAPRNRRSLSKKKEQEAIDYQDGIYERSAQLAMLDDIGRHVHIHWGQLKHWPRFMTARRGIEAKMGLKPGCGNRGRRPRERKTKRLLSRRKSSSDQNGCRRSRR